MPDRLLGVPDAQIVAGLRAGDEGVFDAMFQAYYAPLCEFAWYFVRSMDVAEEVVADVMAAVWDGRASWTPSTSVAAYLYGAVRNRARNAIRGDRRAAQWRDRFSSSGEVPALGTIGAAADDMLEAQDLSLTLRHALDALPERAKLIVTLRWIRQLRYDEIAEALGSTSAAVQMQMSRALKILRERLPEDLW